MPSGTGGRLLIRSDGQWQPSEVDWSLVFWPRFHLVSSSCLDAKRYKEKKHEEGGKKKKRREPKVSSSSRVVCVVRVFCAREPLPHSVAVLLSPFSVYVSFSLVRFFALVFSISPSMSNHTAIRWFCLREPGRDGVSNRSSIKDESQLDKWTRQAAFQLVCLSLNASPFESNAARILARDSSSFF